MLQLEAVHPADMTAFRSMVLNYWRELMPGASVLKDTASQDAYFQEEFPWTDEHQHPSWALLDGRRIGFVNFALIHAEKRADIDDFYVIPDQRRRGCGTQIVRALFQIFDAQGIERIDLSVRRDNPNGLAFWEAQGFMLAKYHLRMYRDPATGTAFRGALSSDFPPPEPAS